VKVSKLTQMVIDMKGISTVLLEMAMVSVYTITVIYTLAIGKMNKSLVMGPMMQRFKENIKDTGRRI